MATPEFRRLSQIRLLNTISPTLATLGEVRRYSHTLGVVRLECLWERRPENEYSRGQLDALQAAIILHDIGTPPFGHLFEYILKEAKGWDHESVITDILHGRHVAENRGHQIYAGNTLKIIEVLDGAGIDLMLVGSIIERRHPLSSLILGSLDFDNIDNVVRMALFLGLGNYASLAKDLAASISVNSRGDLVCDEGNVDLIEEWAGVRKSVYEVLVFDELTVSAQAVLTKAIKIALRNDVLSADDWALTDEELLRRLLGSRETKDLIKLHYLGRLPAPVLTVQLNASFREIWSEGTDNFLEEINRIASQHGVGKPLCYVFQENGAFGKEVEFVDPKTGSIWRHGKRTRSTVVYVFDQNKCRVSRSGVLAILNELLIWLGCDMGLVQHAHLLGHKYDAGKQISIEYEIDGD
ncbi:HD domain-containing protein [Thiohalobacter thiocyanaticus]|uniref:HD domain-containing protein n=1 Tax=Thiohalobacter thiocyanaticus TaxID=585455 RepID=UPI00131A461C|nr:HD domain-containing protein [Thiohalobacter thiocyanaticus]